MSAPTPIHRTVADLTESVIPALKDGLTTSAASSRPSGICGFDGFIDTFIRLEQPKSMAEFGPKVAAAAGIAASYPVRHIGDKFGGNGPLFASGLNDIHEDVIDITYIGALGRESIMPIYREALENKTKQLYSLADPAHSDCLEFTDGKVMLSDLTACADVTLERLLECVEADALDAELEAADFIAAVNWGKMVNVGPICSYLAQRLGELGVEKKKVHYFMDLAEFEGRPSEDIDDLLERLKGITEQCRTMLSFNLKEAWQMGEVFDGAFSGRKDPESVAELAALLREKIDVDRIIIHPNDGAACASAAGTVYVPGPVCREPLISTGAGDNFGAGCLTAALRGLDDAEIILAGNCASGHYVRSGRSASFKAMNKLLDAWAEGKLGERLPE
ncbi:MAG: PfkB family carbohydrate kinase [Opitutales bacterium]